VWRRGRVGGGTYAGAYYGTYRSTYNSTRVATDAYRGEDFVRMAQLIARWFPRGKHEVVWYCCCRGCEQVCRRSDKVMAIEDHESRVHR
jgi:hypothetical protein